ncbi:MAG: pyridoxine 5'-phosphate synthase, partial [Thiomonas sp.]|nr:pyridoxine 5'-phosphate synthase [Thiomonas sp.]
DIICRVRPQRVCLVPERRQEVTTEGGLDVVGQFERVREACARLADCGCVVSLFIEPSAQQIEASARAGAPCIELHTGAYANAFDASDAGAQQREFDRIAAGLKLGRSLGLDTHAGHGLSLQSTPAIAALPEVSELHIGHALIGHAVFVGLTQSVRDFQAAIIRAAADARTN